MINKGQIRKNKKFHIGGLTSDNRAFTLIELLVVISIIALLSTIILGAVNDAREKAQVKKKNEIARQYINALELYASDNEGSYPGTDENVPVCLGFYENNNNTECSPFGAVGSESVDGSLVEYYSSMPTNDDYTVVWVAGFEFKGIMYLCDINYCYVSWYLPDNEQCIYGSKNESVLGITECKYNLN